MLPWKSGRPLLRFVTSIRTNESFPNAKCKTSGSNGAAAPTEFGISYSVFVFRLPYLTHSSESEWSRLRPEAGSDSRRCRALSLALHQVGTILCFSHSLQECFKVDSAGSNFLNESA